MNRVAAAGSAAEQGGGLIAAETRDRVAVLTLDRPDARNAINAALSHALWDAVVAAGSDETVDVVIITGADPAFSAGVDLKELTGAVPPSAPPRGPGLGPERGTDGLYRFVPPIDKPLIAAVNGVCVTGGLELACSLLAHYRRIGGLSAADAQLAEGVLAETWLRR